MTSPATPERLSIEDARSLFRRDRGSTYLRGLLSVPARRALDAHLDDLGSGRTDNAALLAGVETTRHAAETVQRIEHLLYIAEYRRRQAAPGVKVSTRNFGRDRRYPITNRFRERL